MKRPIIIILLFGMLLVTRTYFINKSANIVLYITLINCISFIIVNISIIETAYITIIKEIDKKEINKQLKNNEKRDVTTKKIILCIMNMLVFIGIHLSSELFNDALSIFTIGLSLLDEEASVLFDKLLRKWCRL